jgi:hypothetical protein
MKRPNENDDDVFDEKGCLKDKTTYVVPMQFRDERTVFNDAAAIYDRQRREMCADGLSTAGHKAGWAEDPSRGRAVSYPVSDATIKALEQREAEDQAAWRGTDAASYPPSAEGSSCTIRQATGGAYEGARGIVRNGRCIPIEAAGKTDDAEYDAQVNTARQQITDARELAYVLKDIDDQHAYRLK